MTTILRNARIFDGFSETLIEGRRVVIDGARITEVSAATAEPAGACGALLESLRSSAEP